MICDPCYEPNTRDHLHHRYLWGGLRSRWFRVYGRGWEPVASCPPMFSDRLLVRRRANGQAFGSRDRV
ncbi:hypothetical protein [Lyngbya sp. CCY1209]|uniref:hypothetical protein n=1 Tax=Lyngbya sp. CCY1209 TaxID=2886103 RepID=UPI002D205F56|nr:hypothetical protein [Lyngbya sp. CCY1209]MEB3886351.1 hypothetical protein [Lyngbya sp. CCY1209]